MVRHCGPGLIKTCSDYCFLLFLGLLFIFLSYNVLFVYKLHFCQFCFLINEDDDETDNRYNYMRVGDSLIAAGPIPTARFGGREAARRR